MRAYLRQRERLLDYSASHSQAREKALTQMHLQLHHVVSDITGKTGMAIIRAILDGKREPQVLAGLRDTRCKASQDTIARAWRATNVGEHLLALHQAVALYDTYHSHGVECDRPIEALLGQLRGPEPPAEPLAKARQRPNQPNALAFDGCCPLYAMLAVNLTRIHGFGPYLALKLVGECGTDLSRWPTAKHFVSWLCLSPANKVSGAKVLSAHTRRSKHRTGALLRLAAVNVGKTDTALGAFYRRLATRVGKAKAVAATARKLAILFYNTMRYGMDYSDPGASYYEQRHRARVLHNLARRARQYGYTLEPEAVVANPEATVGVS